MGFPNVAFCSVGNFRRQLILICQSLEIGVQRFGLSGLLLQEAPVLELNGGNTHVLLSRLNLWISINGGSLAYCPAAWHVEFTEG